MARITKPNEKKPGRTASSKPAPAAKNPKTARTAPKAAEKRTTPAKRLVEKEAREFELARIKKTAHAETPAAPDAAPLKLAEIDPGAAARSLPDNYGDNLIYAMVRDPFWVLAYWEIQADHVERTLKKLGSAREEISTILRVYDLSSCPDGSCFFDIRLESMVRNWYIHVNPGRSYAVEIGLLHRDGRFAALARSNVITTPRVSVSDVVDEKWMGGEETQRRIYEASGGVSGAAGTNGRGSGSEELQRMIEKQLLSGVSSGSGAAWLSGVSSASGRPVQLMGQPGKQRGFWFVLDCEVIVYGATEPDARVTLQGREMKLRPDGTFSARFALPDGKFVFEAKAFSADGIEERTITPTVTRGTERPAPIVKEF